MQDEKIAITTQEIMALTGVTETTVLAWQRKGYLARIGPKRSTGNRSSNSPNRAGLATNYDRESTLRFIELRKGWGKTRPLAQGTRALNDDDYAIAALVGQGLSNKGIAAQLGFDLPKVNQSVQRLGRRARRAYGVSSSDMDYDARSLLVRSIHEKVELANPPVLVIPDDARERADQALREWEAIKGEYLTVAEASEMLGVTRQSIYLYIDRGYLTPVNAEEFDGRRYGLGTRGYMFKRSDVEAFTAKRAEYRKSGWSWGGYSNDRPMIERSNVKQHQKRVDAVKAFLADHPDVTGYTLHKLFKGTPEEVGVTTAYILLDEARADLGMPPRPKHNKGRHYRAPILPKVLDAAREIVRQQPGINRYTLNKHLKDRGIFITVNMAGNALNEITHGE